MAIVDNKLESGFYISTNKDRVYNAEHLTGMFDGIMTDGVIPYYGNKFQVTLGGSGMQIKVKSGRGWFNHVWVLNEGDQILEIAPNNGKKRKDLVVIQFRTNTATSNDPDGLDRQAVLKIISGAPSAGTPARPDISGSDCNSDALHTYALAEVYLKTTSTITQLNTGSGGNCTITNLVGVSGGTPLAAIPPLSENIATEIHNYIDQAIGGITEEDVVALITERKIFDTYFYQEGTSSQTNRALPSVGTRATLVVDNNGYPTNAKGFYPELNRTFNIGDLLIGSSGKVALVTSLPATISGIPGVSKGIGVLCVGTIAGGSSDGDSAHRYVIVNEDAEYTDVQKRTVRSNIGAEQDYVDISNVWEDNQGDYTDVYAFLADQDKGKFMVVNQYGTYRSVNEVAGNCVIVKVEGYDDDGFYNFRVYSNGQKTFAAEFQGSGHVGIQALSIDVPDPSTDTNVANLGTFDMIAEEYSSSKVYQIGEYCRHGAHLYRREIYSQTAEAWNTAHWTEIALADEVKNYKTAFVFCDEDLSSPGGIISSISKTRFYPPTTAKVGDYCIGRSGWIGLITQDYGQSFRVSTQALGLTHFLSFKWYQSLSANEQRTARDNIGTVPLSMIAPAYDNTRTYNSGRICIYDDTLWLCVVPVTTPGDFDSSHWQRTTLADEICDLM